MADENDANDDVETLTERANALRREYRAAGTLAEESPRFVAATDLRHALGMPNPAKSLTSDLLARVLAECDSEEEREAAVIAASAESKDDLRADVAELLEMDDAPASLGPYMYRILAAVESANPRYTGLETVVPAKSVDEDYTTYISSVRE